MNRLRQVRLCTVCGRQLDTLYCPYCSQPTVEQFVVPDEAAPSREPRREMYLTVTILCFLVVVLTAPLNGLFGLLLGAWLGQSSGIGLLLWAWLGQSSGILLVVVHTYFFAVIYIAAHNAFRQRSVGVRCVVAAVVTVLYLGFCLGLTGLLFHIMSLHNWDRS
jgi:hypothetical protein